MSARNIGILVAVALLALAPSNSRALSPNAAEVAKLVKANVSEDVAAAYVNNVQAPFSLTADDILALKEQDVSSNVIAAMLNHDAQMRAQVPPPAPNVPAYYPQDSAYGQPPPAQVEVIPDCPGPDYYWNPGYWGWNVLLRQACVARNSALILQAAG